MQPVKNLSQSLAGLALREYPLIGNPKYKAQEDYFDENHSLKKQLQKCQEENEFLHGKLRRLEEENSRKLIELENKKNKDEKPENVENQSSSSLLNNFKQRVFKLELQLKEKETIINSMRRDPRWTKSTELETQNRALLTEVQRLIRLSKQEKDQTISEEIKSFARKLENEKRALETANDVLKEKLEKKTLEDEKFIDKKYSKQIEELEIKIEEIQRRLKTARRQRDDVRDELDELREHFNRVRDEKQFYRRKYQQLKDNHRSHPEDFEKRLRFIRERHAAVVIQRGWREFEKSHRNKKTASSSKTRATNSTTDASLRKVQSVLRAHLNRTNLNESKSNKFDQRRTDDFYGRVNSMNREESQPMRSASPLSDQARSSSSRVSMNNRRSRHSSMNRPLTESFERETIDDRKHFRDY